MTIFAPISGEGARDVVVSDMSGNMAVASFFTEFGFDTFRQSIEEIESRLDEISQQDIPSPTDTEPASEEGFPLLSTILGGALVIALAAAAAMWYRLRTVSRS